MANGKTQISALFPGTRTVCIQAGARRVNTTVGAGARCVPVGAEIAGVIKNGALPVSESNAAVKLRCRQWVMTGLTTARDSSGAGLPASVGGSTNGWGTRSSAASST